MLPMQLMRLSLGPPYTTKGTICRGVIIFELLNENYMTTIHIAQIAAKKVKMINPPPSILAT
jgi:hypothetical protein